VPERAEDDIELGRALASLRRKADKRQEDAGAAVGVGSKHVSAIETGERSPSWRVLRDLLRFYGADLDDLAAEIKRGEG
jgi:transcriptional regulator with XRE-family HTH domain